MLNKLNLFFLPFAGGSKYSYRRYEDTSSQFFNIIPLEYPGRGARTAEPLLRDAGTLVNDLYQQVKEIIATQRYGLFGHSMGGLIGCLLARKITNSGHPPPVHLFFTGAAGPFAVSRNKRKRYLLNKPDFLEEIRKLKGCPQEILQNEDLLDYFEPILRADFTASENYVYTEHPPMNIPITVITGTEEDLTMDEIRSWQKETRWPVDFLNVPGDHFFVLKDPDSIIGIITQTLTAHFKTIRDE